MKGSSLFIFSAGSADQYGLAVLFRANVTNILPLLYQIISGFATQLYKNRIIINVFLPERTCNRRQAGKKSEDLPNREQYLSFQSQKCIFGANPLVFPIVPCYDRLTYGKEGNSYG
jgi:hypothetical protein